LTGAISPVGGRRDRRGSDRSPAPPRKSDPPAGRMTGKGWQSPAENAARLARALRSTGRQAQTDHEALRCGSCCQQCRRRHAFKRFAPSRIARAMLGSQVSLPGASSRRGLAPDMGSSCTRPCRPRQGLALAPLDAACDRRGPEPIAPMSSARPLPTISRSHGPLADTG